MNYYSRKKKSSYEKKKSTKVAILFLFLTQRKKERKKQKNERKKAIQGIFRDGQERKCPQKSPFPGRTQTSPGILINSNLIYKSQRETLKAALFHKLYWVWDIYIATASRWENTKAFYIGNHL